MRYLFTCQALEHRTLDQVVAAVAALDCYRMGVMPWARCLQILINEVKLPTWEADTVLGEVAFRKIMEESDG